MHDIQNFLGFLFLVSIPAGGAYAYWRGLRAGDLGEESLVTLSEDFILAAGYNAPGPWSEINQLPNWQYWRNLTSAQVLQVQRFVAARGWMRFPDMNPLSVIMRDPPRKGVLTESGYRIVHDTPKQYNDNRQIDARQFGTYYEQNGLGSTYIQNGHVNTTSNERHLSPGSLARALRQDANGLPSIDRAVVIGIADDLETTEVSQSQWSEILEWVRDRVGSAYAKGAGTALWSATAALLGIQ
ncbi:hypothetical protein ACM0BF_14195 [Mycobacteroides abscessus subsp. abscessus]|uniref:hypothetical protein n=1 Tax=Mycobacteroides abscessus TaxID=36809 RepID=UPI0039EF609F